MKLTRDQAMADLRAAGYRPLPWQEAFHASPRPLAVGDYGAGKTEALIAHGVLCALQDRLQDGVLMFAAQERARQALDRWHDLAVSAGITCLAPKGYRGNVDLAGCGRVFFVWPERVEYMRGRTFAWGGVDGIDQCGCGILDRVRAGERHRFATVAEAFEPIACGADANEHLALGHRLLIARQYGAPTQ